MTFVDDIVRGWVLGHVAGTLAARRAQRRGFELDRPDLIEKWSLFGAWFWPLAIGISKLF